MEDTPFTWSHGRGGGFPNRVGFCSFQDRDGGRLSVEMGLPQASSIYILTLLPWLERMLNACLSRGYYPWELCPAIVLALHRPGKHDYSLVRSYDPILLLSMMGKIM